MFFLMSPELWLFSAILSAFLFPVFLVIILGWKLVKYVLIHILAVLLAPFVLLWWWLKKHWQLFAQAHPKVKYISPTFWLLVTIFIIVGLAHIL